MFRESVFGTSTLPKHFPRGRANGKNNDSNTLTILTKQKNQTIAMFVDFHLYFCFCWFLLLSIEAGRVF